MVKMRSLITSIAIIFCINGNTALKPNFQHSKQELLVKEGTTLSKNEHDVKNFKNMPNAGKTGSQKSQKEEITYVGAVLEFSPEEYSSKYSGSHIIRENAKTILKYAKAAKKQNADIMITPEYGLQTVSAKHVDPFLPLTQYVPHPSENIVPCSFKNTTNFEVMKILSCGAKQNKIYLVINIAEAVPCSEKTIKTKPWATGEKNVAETDVWKSSKSCQKSGYTFYNTLVIFDRNGKVVSRYRKQNLFNEGVFTAGPKDDESAILVTDFNVRFAMHICFDIVFGHPSVSNILKYDIKDVLMSTAWIDFLPFFLADSTHYGWSKGFGINLLVSGYHKPLSFKMGSGIFRAYKNESSVYSYNSKSGTVLVVANVTTKPYVEPNEEIDIKKSNKDIAVFSSDESGKNELFGQTRTIDLKVDEISIDTEKKFHKSEKAKEKLINGIESYNKSVSGLIPDYLKPFIEILKKYVKNSTHLMLHENLGEYTKVWLKSGEPGETMFAKACNNGTCCHLTYKYSGNQIYTLVALNGRIYTPLKYTSVEAKQCGILWCRAKLGATCGLVELNTASDQFGPFKLVSSSFRYIFTGPMGTRRNLSVLEDDVVQFQKNVSRTSLTAIKPVDNLLSVSFFERNYDL